MDVRGAQQAAQQVAQLSLVNTVNTLNQTGDLSGIIALTIEMGKNVSLVKNPTPLTSEQTTSLLSHKSNISNPPTSLLSVVPDYTTKSIKLTGTSYISFVPDVQYFVNYKGHQVFMTYDSTSKKINVSYTADGSITSYNVGDSIPFINPSGNPNSNAIALFSSRVFTIGSGGLEVNEVTNVVATTSNQSATVTWTNPSSLAVPYSNIVTITTNGTSTAYPIDASNTFTVTNLPIGALVTFLVQISVNDNGNITNSDGLVSNQIKINNPNYVPCFPKGTRLLTATGYKPVEDIEQGELVVTADGRRVPVVVRSRTIEETNEETAPYTIPKSSLAPNIPSHTVRLSPRHAIQLKKGLWMLPFAAAKLGNTKVVQENIGQPVTYYHFECPNYFTDNLVIEGGVVVESFGNKNIKKFPYTYNPGLKGFTRAAQATRITK